MHPPILLLPPGKPWKVSVNMHCHWVKNSYPKGFLTLIFNHFWESVMLALGIVSLCLHSLLSTRVSPALSSLYVSLPLSPGSQDHGWAQAPVTYVHGVNQWAMVLFSPKLSSQKNTPRHDSGSSACRILVGSSRNWEGTGRSSRAVTEQNILPLPGGRNTWSRCVSPESQWSSIDLVHTGNYYRAMLIGLSTRVKVYSLESQGCQLPNMILGKWFDLSVSLSPSHTGWCLENS